MEALHAWVARPPSPVPEVGARPAPSPGPPAAPPGTAAAEVVLVVVSVPGGETTLTRMSRSAADAVVRAESPAILGSVTTAEGRTIYVRDAVRDALRGRPPDGPVAVHALRSRGEGALDDLA